MKKIVIGKGAKLEPVDNFHEIKQNVERYKALKTGVDVHHLKENPAQRSSLTRRMLQGGLRRFVTDNVKNPLFTAIVGSVKLMRKAFGEITRENTTYINTHNILDIAQRFMANVPDAINPKKDGRNDLAGRELFDALFYTVAYEYEHDPFYRYRMEVVLELVIKTILEGRWVPRPENWPPYTQLGDKWESWCEPKPYGGEHSIIYKLAKHRKEILKLLEE